MLKPHNTTQERNIFQNVLGLRLGQYLKNPKTNQESLIGIKAHLNLLNLPSCANHFIHVTQASKQIPIYKSITTAPQVWQQQIIRASCNIFIELEKAERQLLQVSKAVANYN